MKIETTDVFANVSNELLKNAKIELEAEKIITSNDLRNEFTEQLTENCYEYFLKNHKNDLSVFRMNKKNIVLYKGVARVGSADFMTSKGKEMESTLPTVDDWPVYQLAELARKTLSTLFKDPWDHRRSTEYKPSAEKMWAIIEKCIAA